MNNKYKSERIIPKKDCLINKNIFYNPNYSDAVFCECGNTIHFKNRKPYESVIVKCSCGKEIIYG